MGDGTTTDRITPIQVNSLSGIIAMAGGRKHALFLKNDGTVWSCGSNDAGQLGYGNTTKSYTPIQVDGLSGIAGISASKDYALFLKNDSTVWVCGYNDWGQLGNGTQIEAHYAFQISGLSGVVAIAAGGSHSLFMKNNGSVWASGKNGSRQFGNGSLTSSKIPIEVLNDPQCLILDIKEENDLSSMLSVYPNPANGNIVIETVSANWKSNQATLKIVNAVGQEVLQFSLNDFESGQSTMIDVSSLSPLSTGIYIVNLSDGENQGQVKFVKQ